jgi:hypothetical protein
LKRREERNNYVGEAKLNIQSERKEKIPSDKIKEKQSLLESHFEVNQQTQELLSRIVII